MSGKFRKRVSDNEFSTTNYYGLCTSMHTGRETGKCSRECKDQQLQKERKLTWGWSARKRLKGGGGSEKVQRVRRVCTRPLI